MQGVGPSCYILEVGGIATFRGWGAESCSIQVEGCHYFQINY